MKVLTLHQPWASLVAVGAKWIETRGQPTYLRERIAIHAAARSTHRTCDLDGLVLDGWRVSVDREYVWMEHQAGAGSLWGDDGYVPLVFGSIVATAELFGCVPIIDHVGCGPFLDRPPHVCTAPPDALYLHHPIRGPISEVTSEVPAHDQHPRSMTEEPMEDHRENAPHQCDDGCDVAYCQDCGEGYSDPCERHRSFGHVRSFDPYGDGVDCQDCCLICEGWSRTWEPT